MADLEILGVPQSNFVWVCRIAAAEKGVPLTIVPARPHTPEIDAIHPFGQMPAMRHGDVRLFETKGIVTYIDKAFPGPALMPTDALAAAQTEQWVSAINANIDPHCVRQYLVAYFFPGTPDGKPDRARIEAATPKMKAQLGILDAAVRSTGHLVGHSFGIADMFLLPILFYLSRMPESSAALNDHATLSAYLARHLERKSVKDTTPPPMPS